MAFEEFRKEYEEKLAKLAPAEKENLTLLGLWTVSRTAKLLIEIINENKKE